MPKEYIAEFLRINASNLILRRELIDYPTMKTRIKECARGLRIEMGAYVAAMPSKRIEIDKKWPRDWWQALRERWFPQWWLNCHPVQYDRIYINQQLYSNVCPHLQRASQHDHLKFLSFGFSKTKQIKIPGPGEQL